MKNNKQLTNNIFKNIVFMRQKNYVYDITNELKSTDYQAVELKYGLIALAEQFISFFLFIGISYKFMKTFVELFSSYFSNKITSSVMLFVSVILIIIAATIIHEAIHYISLPKRSKRDSLTFILFKLPFFIGVANKDLRSKKEEIIHALSPLVIISFITLLAYLLISSPILKLVSLYVLLYNLFGSFTDILRAIFVAKTAGSQDKIIQKYVLKIK